MATFQTGARQPMNGSYEQLTVTNAVKTLTVTKYRTSAVASTSIVAHTVQTTLAEEALITVEAQSIRWTVDGTDPTTTVGHLAAAGDVIDLEGFDSIRKFKAIRATGSDSTINVTYFCN